MEKCKDCEAFWKGKHKLRGQVRHACMKMFVSMTDNESESIPKWCPDKK